MRLKLGFFMWMTLAVGYGYAQPLASIRVITWNIRLDTPNDGNNAWAYRKADFCAFLRLHQADVIGFQEVLHNQLLDLQSCLPEYQFVGVGRADGQTGGEYSPVFFNNSRFLMLEGNTQWLSETPEVPGSVGWDAALERIVSWAILTDMTTGDTLVFMNTHFDHMGQKARENSARFIVALAQRLSQGKPLIAMGDLNVTPEHPAYEHFISAGFTDARAQASDALAQKATYTGFDENPQNDALIDFILYLPHFEVLEYKVLDAKANGRYLSDHLPVKAILVRKQR